ncbi:F-box/kelch-repeat protein At3g06240-like [Rhododendron vialii]|uniref:F-box/kelch-repeat protein At3g06240-like n=1 Tax=Rhododendron vialii TaxID=182163 RepID=UPI0026602D44|nr:F-box/kelch-repeat protein At3g06240-like [Rhododendron vialii]
MSNDEILPQEILTDILSRLPVKSLFRFKSVSPSWNSLISGSEFVKTHLNRTKKTNYAEQKIIIITSSSTSYNLHSIDFACVNPTIVTVDLPDSSSEIKVLSSCEGLLLVNRYDDSNFLLNPSTRECRELPPFPFALPRANVYGVGYDSLTDDYKVVIFSYFGTPYSAEHDTIIVAVYSLKTNAWRRIQGSHNYVLQGTSCGVFVNGRLHFLCRRNESYVIVAFDLSEESFKELQLPALFGTDGSLYYYRAAVLGGCLCLVDQRYRKTEFWMMKEYEVRESWLKFTIGMPELYTVDLLCMLAEDEFLLKNWFRIQKLVVYSSKKETLRDMVVRGFPAKFRFGSTYVESLVSPNHGGGIGRQ